MVDITSQTGLTTAGPRPRGALEALPLASDRWGTATSADYLLLLKPRVMSLSIFTAMVGLVLAPVTIHWVIALAAILAISVGAGAAGALNMWYEAELDSKMHRTSTRPVPGGRIAPDEALAFGIVLSLGSVLSMAVLVNYLAAALLALTIFYYVVIYTMWLKPRSAQNIVIGGAAGAFPPVIGWAAAAGTVSLEPWILFLIIFMWTPPHFWALALVRSADYRQAGLPMMPVVAGAPSTRRQILFYTLALLATSALPVVLGFAGWIYGAASGLLGIGFLACVVNLMRTGARAERAERMTDEGNTGSGAAAAAAQAADIAALATFKYSLVYLFGVFAALFAEGVV